MKLLILVSLISFNSWALKETTQSLGTSDQKIKFFFESSDDKTAKKVKEFEIAGNKVKVEDGEWLNNDDEVDVEEIDLDFDKKNDYGITVRRGISNRYVMYLLWNETEKKFIPLGVQAELSLVEKKRCWSGIEKGNEEKAVLLKVQNKKFVNCSK